MKFTNAATLGLLAALSSTTGAVNILAYGDSRGCNGNALRVVDAQRNLCYDDINSRFSSLRLEGSDQSVTGYIPQEGGFQCGTVVAQSENGGCASESNGQLGGIIGFTWEFTSEQLPVPGRRRRSTSTQPCGSPDQALIGGKVYDFKHASAEQKQVLRELVFGGASAAEVPAALSALAL